jgi:hypothetical protein
MRSSNFLTRSLFNAPSKAICNLFANLFFGLLAQVIALLIGIFIPQHLLPIYELEGVFASIPVISPPPVISHTMKGEVSVFYADRKSKMAPTAGHRLTLDPF